VPGDGKKDGDDLDHGDSRSVLTAKLDAGQFVLNIFSTLAQFERRLIQERLPSKWVATMAVPRSLCKHIITLRTRFNGTDD